ncbi:MAG: hypothetical protein M3081_06900 [Gemmatimonadota bacterium]|nr:hypothetical protein [Gemmatimonadota bacterium]
MASFREHDVESAVSVDVADAHVRRCLGGLLEHQHAIESREAVGVHKRAGVDQCARASRE